MAKILRRLRYERDLKIKNNVRQWILVKWRKILCCICCWNCKNFETNLRNTWPIFYFDFRKKSKSDSNRKLGFLVYRKASHPKILLLKFSCKKLIQTSCFLEKIKICQFFKNLKKNQNSWKSNFWGATLIERKKLYQTVNFHGNRCSRDFSLFYETPYPGSFSCTFFDVIFVIAEVISGRRKIIFASFLRSCSFW